MRSHFFGKALLYPVAALTVIFFLLAANPFGLSFLNDDFIHVPRAAGGDFFHSNLVRPVADITMWFDHFLYGWNATGFHLTNMLIHLINAVLVYTLVRRIFRNDEREFGGVMALFVSSLFLVYAFHSESVFWVIGRGGSLAALFMLVSLNCYVISKRLPSMLVSLLSFSIGLFTYEFVWVMPLIIPVFQVWDLYNKKTYAWRWSLSFIIIFVIYLLVRSKIGSAHFSEYEIGSIRHLRIGKLLFNYFATLIRCFLPPVPNSNLFVALAVGLWIVITAAVVSLLRRNDSKARHLVLPFLCLMVSCLPSVSLGIDTHDGEGGRFLYVPSIFFCWLVTELIFILFAASFIRVALMAAVLVFHGVYFYLSAVEYRYASDVVTRSLDCLSTLPAADTLVVEGLPSQYGGALIFRSGFSNALDLMMPGRFGSVRILSQSEIHSRIRYECAGSVSGSVPVNVKWSDNGSIYFSDAIR